jgi:hypothetical protein
MNREQIEELVTAILSADWYYNYTDDYGAYNRGEASVRKVTNIIEKNECTIDDFHKVVHELKNQLALRYVGKIIEEKTYTYWDTKVKYLFRKVLENE